MEEFCTIHPKEGAVGKCSDCRKPHCLDCLDMDTGVVLCPSCKGKRADGAASAPAAPPTTAPSLVTPKPAASPFDFKGKGLDDDPLGLMNAPTAPKPAPAAPPKPSFPAPAPPAPKPFVPDLKPLPSKPPTPSPLDLEGLGPKGMGGSPLGTPPAGSAPPLSYPLGSISGLPSEKSKPGAKAYYLWKTWSKYLVRRAYETFDPLAQKLRIPTFAVIALIVAIGVGLVAGLGFLLRPSSVKLVGVLEPLHMVKVGTGQIHDLDVTSYMELQGQVQNLGFSSLTQLTVAQLPSTNFFDVWVKEEVGTYGEILKFPNQITPRLSFVTVFANGTWLATDSWEGGKNHLGLLDAECFPGTPPDQLYVKHVQRVERMKKEGHQLALMGENRYMAALSDHLRWYLDAKDLPAYKAEFKSFH